MSNRSLRPLGAVQLRWSCSASRHLGRAATVRLVSDIDHAAWNAWVIEQFRETNGEVPGYDTMPVALLTTKGAKSGEARLVPLCYVPYGDYYLITPVNGGRPQTPAWFINLLAHDVALFEVGRAAFTVRATVVTGQGRAELWERFIAAQPDYVEHATERDIPIVVLEPLGPSPTRADHRVA